MQEECKENPFTYFISVPSNNLQRCSYMTLLEAGGVR